MLLGSLMPATSSDNSPRGTKVTDITSLTFPFSPLFLSLLFPSPATEVLSHTPAAPRDEERRVLPPGGGEEAKSVRLWIYTFTFALLVTRRIKLLRTKRWTPGLWLHTHNTDTARPGLVLRAGQSRGSPDAKAPAQTPQHSPPPVTPLTAAPTRRCQPARLCSPTAAAPHLNTNK